MASLSGLYQDLILDHNRAPQNFRRMEDANRRVEGINPLCGDRLTVWLRMEDGVIKDAAFQGSGCAISKASASLMTSAVKGKTREEAEALFERFRRLVTGLDGAGRSGVAGQAGGVLRPLGVPHSGQMRQPLVACPEGGAQ